MATKATKKNIFSTVDRRATYLMHDKIGVVVLTDNKGRLLKGNYVRLVPMHNIRNAVMYYFKVMTFGRSGLLPQITVYTRYGAEQFTLTVYRNTGRLSVGCNVFSATTIRRWAKWVGVRVPKTLTTTSNVNRSSSGVTRIGVKQSSRALFRREESVPAADLTPRWTL